jgi:hypothetical protein
VIAGVALGLTVYILAVRVLGLGEYRMVAGMLHRRLGRA